MRETWFNALGLITQPNELGVFPSGAMKRADGLVARSPGELQARQAAAASFFSFSLGSDFYVMSMLYTGQQLLMIVGNAVSPNTSYAVWTSGASAGFLPDDQMQIASANWVNMVMFRDRVFVCSEADVIVFENLDPSTFAQRTARVCGLPQPIITLSSAGGTDPQAIPPQRCVAYAAIIRRTYPDGYEIVSPPSLIKRVSNPNLVSPGNDWNVTFTCQLPNFIGSSAISFNLRAGDVIELYRTQSVPTATSNPVEIDPGTTCYLVSSYTLTSTDVTNNFVSLSDTAKDGPIGQGFGGLGEALYTNPGQLGLEGVNTPPPAAKVMASYKGRMFYANYATPGDTTISFHGGFGMLDLTTYSPPGIGIQARRYGVGYRHLSSGTVTSGSPTITGISANDMVGVVIGQYFSSGLWNTTTYIVSVTASTITVTANALTSGTLGPANNAYVADMIGLAMGGTSENASRVNEFAARYAASARTLSETNIYMAFDQGFYMTNLFSPLTSLFLRATNGQNYDPPLPLITAVNSSGVITAGGTPKAFAPKSFKNGLRFSKDQQPEAVPPTNEIFIGQGEIYGMYSTRDALWIFASDGLWRLSGTMSRSGQVVDVRVDPVDSTLILSGPKAGCVLRDSVYAFTNRGLVRVDDLGVAELSERTVGDLLVSQTWETTGAVLLCADEDNDDIYITLRSQRGPGSGASKTYVYSAIYNVFTGTDSTTEPFNDISAMTFSRTGFQALIGFENFAGGTYKITNNGSINGAPVVVDFQPTYAEGPFAAKQWIDSTVVLNIEATAVTAANPRWDGAVLATGTNQPRADLTGVTSRINYGVPRAQAVGNLVSFGVQVPLTTGFVIAIKGVSMRFEMLSEQQVVR